MNWSTISKKFTNETLKEIAKNAGITSPNVKAQFIDPKTKKGESFLSNIHRLKVTGQDKEVKVLIKVIPKNAAHRDAFQIEKFFRNEINFYTKIIPAFMKFQKSTNSKDIFVEYPRCLASYCDGVNDFIVLEDINVEGYVAPTIQDYTEIETCCMILKVLGRFHAVSLAFKDQQPEEFSKLIDFTEETYYMESNRTWYGGFLKLAISVALDAVSKTFPNSDYLKKSENFLNDKLYDDMISMVDNKTAYAVIGHGDCWRPNFLTKYDRSGTKPEAVKIIDFQLVRYGSPILDIMFLLYNSTSHEQRNNHYEELLKAYHSSAYDLIRNLGSNPDKIYSYDQFKEELQMFGRFGVGFAIESLPLTLMDEKDFVDPDSITFENSTLLDFWKIKPMEKVEHRERVAYMFKHAIDNSYIN